MLLNGQNTKESPETWSSIEGDWWKVWATKSEVGEARREHSTDGGWSEAVRGREPQTVSLHNKRDRNVLFVCFDGTRKSAGPVELSLISSDSTDLLGESQNTARRSRCGLQRSFNWYIVFEHRCCGWDWPLPESHSPAALDYCKA